MKIEKINELFARFAGQLLKMRWITLGIFALVIIVSVIGMKRMVKETSFDDYFIEDDPMLVMTDEFKSHFGNDYYVGVLTQCDDHFTKENLTTLRTLSNELLDSLSYADKVTSLTDIEFMVGSDGRLTYAYGTQTLAFDKQAQIYMASIHARAIHDVNPRRGCSDFYGISPPFVK